MYTYIYIYIYTLDSAPEGNLHPACMRRPFGQGYVGTLNLTLMSPPSSQLTQAHEFDL